MRPPRMTTRRWIIAVAVVVRRERQSWLTRTLEPGRMPEAATCDPAPGIDRMGIDER